MQAASTKLMQADQVILVSAGCLVSVLISDAAAAGCTTITATAPDSGPGVGDRARAERPFGSLQAY